MKVQVAIEFMIIFAAFLLALTIIVIASWNNVVNINRSALDFEANRILNLAANRINTAYLEGDGFSIDLAVPEKVGSYEYTLEIEGNMLWLNLNEMSYHRMLLTSNITGILKKGVNTIRNVEGGVVIS